MSWYIVLTLVSAGICLLACLYHIFRIISLGKPRDFSDPAGNILPAVAYAFTGAMSPRKKESAYLHLPTYTAGIIYHLGTFLSIFLFLIILMDFRISRDISLFCTVFLSVSGLCGVSILVKRMVKKELQSLSNPDDYISNILVTGFQLVTAVFLQYHTQLFFIIASCLLLYLPFGKLKHTLYFFAARYQLGFFYGHRGVWPPKN